MIKIPKIPEKYSSWIQARLNVSQKIIIGYVVLSLFSLSAILIALFNIQQQVGISDDLVNRDFRAISIIRDLRQNLLAQERLEQQFLILKDNEMLSLLESRHVEFKSLWDDFKALGIQASSAEASAEGLFVEMNKVIPLLKNKPRQTAEKYLDKNVNLARDTLNDQLDVIAEIREVMIDDALLLLNEESETAFRVTMALLILGVAIGGGVASRVVRSITRSVNHLSLAAREASEGRFDFNIEKVGRDEFGLLASEFVSMGKKLNDLQSRLLDANPLTHLPGNLTIEQELERRIMSLEPFAHIYVDLDHFKAYNDRYGYQKGSDVIAAVGKISKDVVERVGNAEDLVGHIGGDDYLLLSTPDKAENIAKDIIKKFENMLGSIYTPEDLEAGSYEGIDRFGEKRIHPLMSMSIAIICSENLEYPSIQEISLECAKMKEHLKNLPGSNYLIDRRRR